MKIPKPKRFKDSRYLEHIRAQPCCYCFAPPKNHPHHVISVGAGGGDHYAIPLCWQCHVYAHSGGIDREWLFRQIVQFIFDYYIEEKK